MNAEQFSSALGKVKDKYIMEAVTYKSKKKSGWLKLGALAACFCLVIISSVHFYLDLRNEHATDIEPRIALTLEEAACNDTFGELFPTRIIDGYILEDSVGIYDGTVMQARFYNEAARDELVIEIANKEWFYNTHQNLDLNTILYQETTRGISSAIYIEGGDYIVYYSFATSDLKANDDFLTMVTSATHFKEANKSMNWSGNQLY